MTEEYLIERIHYAVEEYCKGYPSDWDEVKDYWSLVRHFLENNPNLVFDE